MNDLILSNPKPPAAKARRKNRGRGGDLVAIADDGSSNRILALPPPDEPPKAQSWRSGVFGVLDIGSTKVTCLIGKAEQDGIKVLGWGWRRSRGVRGGAITDLAEAESAIRSAVGQAEDAAEKRIDQVIVNLSSGHPESRLFNVRWPVGGREITDDDVRRVVSEGQMRARSEGRMVIHTLPLSYSVDDTTGINDPRGHLGEQLIARLHVVDASSTTLRTLEAVLARAELKLQALVSAPIASGLSVLDKDELELGATVVEMGGGTTSLAIFGEGQVLHTAYLPVGGLHITRDIAGVLSTSLEHAERLKNIYGSAELSSDDEHQMLQLQLIGEAQHNFTSIPRSRVGAIIRPRIEETLELVRDRLDGSGLGRAADGRVVLTGGGSLLEGVGPLAARILNRPVRLGRPQRISGLPEESSPSTGFSTAAGLLTWAAGADRMMNNMDFSEPRPSGIVRRVVNFFRERV